MRMGKVQFSIWYAVDLDEPYQIDVAKDFVAEDVDAAVKYNQVEDYFEIVEDSSLTRDDIHSSIIELSSENGADFPNIDD
jgi:hypothetical protein